MMRRLIGLLMIALAPALRAQGSGGTTCTVVAPATSCSVDVTASMSISRVFQLDLSLNQVAFPSIGVSEMNAGTVATPGPGAVIKSNAPWRLMISSGSQSSWQSLNGGTKATSDLEWSTSAAGSFSSLSTTAATAATGNVGGNFFTSFYLRSRIGWQLDKPDQYSLTMMFTLTAP